MTNKKTKILIEAIGEGFLLLPLVGLFVYSICRIISSFIKVDKSHPG